MQITVAADIRAAAATLTDLAKRQVPYASALSVNDLAFQVRAAETEAIASTFRNPRPFTRKSVGVDKATKGSPTATVAVRAEVAKYLAPYEFGGKHVLPSRALLDPKNVRLDQYGQLPRTALARLAARPGVFVGAVTFKRTGQTVNGFWERGARGKRRGGGGHGSKGKLGLIGAARTGLKLLIRFGDALPVKQRLGFRDRGEALVKAQFATAFANAMARALRK